jgi:putative transposase
MMCRCLGVSRSGYYAWSKRPESPRSRRRSALGLHVRAAFAASRKTYGSPRLTAELLASGIRTSRHVVAKMMRAANLVARKKRRFVRTTTPDAAWHAAGNVLARSFAPGRDQVWVADTTYLAVPEGWLYLAVLISLRSRRVVGWAASARNDCALVLAALNNALHTHPPPLMHHSDRGGTYTSEPYLDALAAHRIKSSMSRKGNCWDNAVAESFFSTLKVELGARYPDRVAATTALFDYIDSFYNTRRRHSALGYLSPHDYEVKMSVT